MAYDDRDYFQSKPKFEFASGLPNGTKGLMIAVVAAYVVGIIVSNSISYTGEEFWRAWRAGPSPSIPTAFDRLARRLRQAAPIDVSRVHCRRLGGHPALRQGLRERRLDPARGRRIASTRA